jgi:sugar-specific transcriptional regulator TrmB
MASTELDDQTNSILSELELGEYEVRAYLTILEGGVVVAREISDRASIPYAKVYQTLNSLIAKQLILGDEGRPKKFRARDPEEAISDRLESMEREWLERHTKRKSILEKVIPDLKLLFDQSDVDVEQEQGVWNIVGLSNIISRVTKLIELCQDEVVVVSGNSVLLHEHLLRIFQEVDSLEISLISTEQPLEADLFANIIMKPSLGNAVQIYFDDFAMISIVESERGRYSSGEFSAVLTQIAEIVRSNLEMIDLLR